MSFRSLLPAAIFLGFLLPLAAAGTALTGTWRIDPSHSTELSPWKDYELTITVDDDRVTLRRKLAWGRREYADTMQIDTSRTESVGPMEMWPDNRHLGAYIGGDRSLHVRAEWLDDRRILRLSTDLVLDTQQGSRGVNILSDYKVSADGGRLTLTELRSTRNRPVVYTFTRVRTDSQ